MNALRLVARGRRLLFAVWLLAVLAVPSSSAQSVVLSTILATGFENPEVGLEAGTFVTAVETKKLLDSGDLVFRVTLDGDTITPNNDQAYLRYSETNGFSIVWRQSAGGPVGDLTSILDYIDDQGRILIVKFLEGQIWLINSTGVPVLLAANGDPAPGMPTGAVFSQVFAGQPHFEDGVFTMGALATGGGLTSNNDYGIWRTVADFPMLELLVQEGDTGITPKPVDSLQGMGLAQSADDLIWKFRERVRECSERRLANRSRWNPRPSDAKWRDASCDWLRCPRRPSSRVSRNRSSAHRCGGTPLRSALYGNRVGLLYLRRRR